MGGQAGTARFPVRAQGDVAKDIFALFLGGIADDHQRDIGLCRGPCGGGKVGFVSMGYGRLAQQALQPLQRGDDIGRADPARSVVASVFHGGQTAQHGDPYPRLERQCAVIFQQDSAFLGRLQRQRAMGVTGDEICVIGGQGVFHGRKAQLRGEDAAAGAINDMGFDRAGFDRRHEMVAKNQRLGVFDVEAG